MCLVNTQEYQSFFLFLLCRTFNTTVDIRLKQWADVQLPKKCVEVWAVDF
jgi:hypothetical protein